MLSRVPKRLNTDNYQTGDVPMTHHGKTPGHQPQHAPTTSIIIATLDNAKTIRRCVESVIASYRIGQVKEIIVVDGGSTDKTLDLLEGLPVKVIHDLGRGVGDAYEQGARTATGDFLFFLDADQYISDDFFPAVYSFFVDEKVAVMGCQSTPLQTNRITRAQSQWSRWKGVPGILAVRNRLAEGHAYGPGGLLFLRRLAFEDVNGWRGASRLTTARLADITMSEKVKKRGWKMATPQTQGYWLQAPVYEYLRDTLQDLLKQQFLYGVGAAAFHSLIRRDLRLGPILVFSRIFSYPVCLVYTIRSRSLLHLALFWPTRLAWVTGYLRGLQLVRRLTEFGVVE